jgi:hypothetical protein
VDTNLDPSKSIHCVATIFGLTYKGYHDPTDNGIGAFEDPSTGRFYRTANKVLVGVSIPIPFYERTPDMSRADIQDGLVTVTILDSHGNWYDGIKIVDLGPGAHDRLLKEDGTPRLLDRSYALCAQMAQKGNPMDNVWLRYWILKAGTPYSIQGQDTPYTSE